MVEGAHKSKTDTLVVVINAPSQDNVKKQTKFDTMRDCQNILNKKS